MLPVKLNVARAAPGLRFQIIEPGQVAWSDQPVDITAEDLFASKAEHPDEARSKVTSAFESLEQALADGPRRAKDLKREAGENCITWRTLERACSNEYQSIEQRRLWRGLVLGAATTGNAFT